MNNRQSPDKSSGISLVTHVGMALLYAGIAVSIYGLFFPGIELTPELAPPVVISHVLWLCGAALLTVQPLREKAWTFMVFEVSMVLAALLPLLSMSLVSAALLRSVFTLVVILWLGSLEGMQLCWALLPWRWGQVWRRQLGDTALAVLGSELLCWGYAMFGVSAVLAWVCLVAGSIVMMRFGWAGKVSGIKIAVAWYHLNAVYVLAGLIQLAGIVWSLAFLHGIRG
jgi:hypothetical protein